MEGEAPELLRKLANRLLPVNLLEFLPYAALAATAGVCEEFVYRGICDRRDIQGWRASLVGRDLVVGRFSVWLTHTKDGAE